MKLVLVFQVSMKVTMLMITSVVVRSRSMSVLQVSVVLKLGQRMGQFEEVEVVIFKEDAKSSS